MKEHFWMTAYAVLMAAFVGFLLSCRMRAYPLEINKKIEVFLGVTERQQEIRTEINSCLSSH